MYFDPLKKNIEKYALSVHFCPFGIGASIRISQEIQCLQYVGLFYISDIDEVEYIVNRDFLNIPLFFQTNKTV